MTMVCVQVHGATAAVGFAGCKATSNSRLQASHHLQFSALVTLITDACHGYVEYMLRASRLTVRIRLVREELADAGNNAAPQGRLRQGRPDSPHGACRAQQPARGGAELGYLTGEEFDQL